MFLETAQIIHNLLFTVSSHKELCDKIGRENFWNYLDFVQEYWGNIDENVKTRFTQLLPIDVEFTKIEPLHSYRFAVYMNDNQVGECRLNVSNSYQFR